MFTITCLVVSSQKFEYLIWYLTESQSTCGNPAFDIYVTYSLLSSYKLCNKTSAAPKIFFIKINQLKPHWPTETYVQVIGQLHKNNWQVALQRIKQPTLLERGICLVIKLSYESNAPVFVKQTIPQVSQCNSPYSFRHSLHQPSNLPL